MTISSKRSTTLAVEAQRRLESMQPEKDIVERGLFIGVATDIMIEGKNGERYLTEGNT